MATSVANPFTDDQHPGEPFVFGFAFSDGAAQALTWEDARAKPAANEAWRWLHFNINEHDARAWIREEAGLPKAATNAMLAGETRPRVSTYGEGLVVNLRGVNLNEGSEPEDMVSIRIWIDQSRMISARLRNLKATHDVRDSVKAGFIPANPGALLSKIAFRLAERIQPFIQELEDEVDGLEDAMLSGEGSRVRAQLADTRHDAVLLRRFIAPQRDALNRLANDECALFDAPTRSELHETADLVTRHTESIDAARERAMVLQDQLTDQRAEEMNRNMMILSVVAAIFLPLGFITGLFGINVGGMPGIESGVAFWLVVGVCALIGGALVALFKFLDWL